MLTRTQAQIQTYSPASFMVRLYREQKSSAEHLTGIVLEVSSGQSKAFRSSAQLLKLLSGADSFDVKRDAAPVSAQAKPKPSES